VKYRVQRALELRGRPITDDASMWKSHCSFVIGSTRRS
jgi:hypothetical protein